MKNLANTRAFKITVLLLCTSWLTILFWHMNGGRFGVANISKDFSVEEEKVLTTQDLDKIEDLKGDWAEDDKDAEARLIAESATAAFQLGDYENAIDLYNKALKSTEFDPENTLTLLTNLAIAYESFSDSPNAITTYETIKSKLTTADPLYHIAAGEIALLGEYIDGGTAISEFKKALKLESNNFDANNVLGLIYLGEYGNEYKDFRKALEYNKKTNKLDPKNLNVKLNLALNYIELKYYDLAKEQLNLILEVTPQSIPANYLIMKTYYLEGNKTQSKRYARQLVTWIDTFKQDKLVAEILNTN